MAPIHHTAQYSTQFQHTTEGKSLTLFVALGLAFAVSSNRTASLSPLSAALCSGVHCTCCQSHHTAQYSARFHHTTEGKSLTEVSALGLAFAASSNCTASLSPLSAAQCSGVYLSCCQSHHTAQYSARFHHTTEGKSLTKFTALGLAFAASSNCTASLSPYAAALYSEVSLFCGPNPTHSSVLCTIPSHYRGRVNDPVLSIRIGLRSEK